ncbi:uncharacterized protein LOC136037570 [Artemia franciscana]|uniref:uncharacterized protein LOC136037570 n=1 Tax=Artemia franciscana TaxID=6661 RepID=UPI0032DA8994
MLHKNYRLVDAVRQGDLKRTRELINADNSVEGTNLIILACENNRVNILKYLLSSNGKILSNLYYGTRETVISPSDEDEACHNAFYYALRSGNVELLDTLINKWPGNYFAVHLMELNEILSQAYEELKLKNVVLSDKIKIFVEDKLIDFRFSFNSFEQDKNMKSNLNSIRERIELLLQSISVLRTEYCNGEEIDGKFLFIAKFITQNINILKRQLKCTYNKLPWEEIEFCLITFISSQIKHQEINLYCNVTLNRNKILNHLKYFAEKLKEEKDNLVSVNIEKLIKLPNLNRGQVVTEIVSNSPEFGELYSDYQQIRDIHSLQKISDIIKLASSVYLNQREGKLIISRVLQVTGEHLKNTLESPKLSTTTSELILQSLPRNTRKVIVDLRNSLSHAYSLSKRMEIEKNTNEIFFEGIQKDLKGIFDVITDILHNSKMRIIRKLLDKISSCKSLDDLREVSGMFSSVELNEITGESLKLMEDDKLENLVQQLRYAIADKTNHEKRLFDEIDIIINLAKMKSTKTRTDSSRAIILLKSLFVNLNKILFDLTDVEGLKFYAKEILNNIPFQIDSHNRKEIFLLSMKICHIALLRIPEEKKSEVEKFAYQIYHAVDCGTSDIKWVEELRNKLNDKSLFINKYKQRKDYNITEEKYNNLLELKLSELKSILRNNELCGNLTEKLPSYKRDKKLQGVIEMIFLDILSILTRSENHLENNLFFSGEKTPLLTGKCLRNHLAHYNDIIDLMSSDPLLTVILIAKKLITDDRRKSNISFSKSIKDNPPKLKNKFDQNLTIITNQETMFLALKEGNLEHLKSCLRKGADINAKSINSSTALHFAAYGPGLEVIKFVTGQKIGVNTKNINGQSALHIAAANGRENIVEFFLRETKVNFDDPDNNGRTALHVAAKNGHKGAVEALLKKNAKTDIIDNGGNSPLHYAVANNHIDVVRILLRKETNVDNNETTNGLTSLHISAERGHLGLVDYLIKSNAEINAKSGRAFTPLHFAAFRGHLKVVKVLIQNGANVNAVDIQNCTPLHHASGNHQEQIVNVLLENGANVNAVEKNNNTPLHCAAKHGHEKIVSILLQNNANASISTVAGVTPLHFAVASGQVRIVAALLEVGVNIFARDTNNETPLHYAAWTGQKTIAKFLIEHGAEINAKSNYNRTPLSYAASNGHRDIIELLIISKADVRVQCPDGRTALHLAAWSASKDVVDILLQNKADVNAQDNNGMTPLHVAACNGNSNAIVLLIENKADVNAKAKCGIAPLDTAVLGGHKEAVYLLIKNKAEVNKYVFTESTEKTPLHSAIDLCNKEIVEILVANGANVNIKCNNVTPLISAIKKNHKEIVEVLIANGANINAICGMPSVVIDLKAKEKVNPMNPIKVNPSKILHPEDNPLAPIHFAAVNGYTDIINLLIVSGASVNAVTDLGVTPLYLAAQYGHEEGTKGLIEKNANGDYFDTEGRTPLHRATLAGHTNVVRVLLSNGANPTIKNNEGVTPLELAVDLSRFEVVKLLLHHDKVDINAKCNDEWTVLHIASMYNNLEIVKYLVSEGSNINAKTNDGRKPIHVAAKSGHIDTVEFFLSKGLGIDVSDAENRTLLHYAVDVNQLEVVKYLIAKGADINTNDVLGQSPLHGAAFHGYKDIVEVLLKHGASYSGVDNYNLKPINMTKSQDVIILLESTEKLIRSVKRNSPSEAENFIKAGAIVDVKIFEKTIDGSTSLHYAAWKGYEGIVKTLLQNKANPNVVANKKYTPLHYAAKFSQIEIVKCLLSHGAIYNAGSESGKTPLDFSVDRDIAQLFKLISESFEKVKDCDSEVIKKLHKIKNISTVKAVMSARNRDNQTLITAAIQCNFPEVEQLKQIFHVDVSDQIKTAMVFSDKGNYQEALKIFRSIFEKRKEILGSENPGTLDIQIEIAKLLFNQGMCQEALTMLEDVVQKQSVILGLNNKDTLSTRSLIALVLHRQGEKEKALDIYQEVHQKQKEILELHHSDTLDTQFRMAFLLYELGKYEEAMSTNMIVFEKYNENLGPDHFLTLHVEYTIGMILCKLGKLEEALKILNKNLEKGNNFPGEETLTTLNIIAEVLFAQEKYREALNTYQEVLSIRRKVLPKNHRDTLNTQYKIGNTFFAQGKWTSALKVYRECFDKIEATFGPNDPVTLDILKKLEILDCNDTGTANQTLVHYSAITGHLEVIRYLISKGADVNAKDNNGSSPMHIAANFGYKDVIEVLFRKRRNLQCG